jgi:hypothetical protein
MDDGSGNLAHKTALVSRKREVPVIMLYSRSRSIATSGLSAGGMG